MKRRFSDEGDKITEAEVKKARKGLFDWFTLFLTNWTAVKGLVTLLVLLLGAGTVTNEAVYTKLIPQGQVVSDTDALDVTLESMKSAIDSNTAGKAEIREELREIREQLANERARGDAQLRNEIEAIKKLVN